MMGKVLQKPSLIKHNRFKVQFYVKVWYNLAVQRKQIGKCVWIDLYWWIVIDETHFKQKNQLLYVADSDEPHTEIGNHLSHNTPRQPRCLLLFIYKAILMEVMTVTWLLS